MTAHPITAEALEAEYGHDGEHEGYTRASWSEAIAMSGGADCGDYWHFVADQLNAETET